MKQIIFVVSKDKKTVYEHANPSAAMEHASQIGGEAMYYNGLKCVCPEIAALYAH